ncbi:MAG TPA: DUF4340 domain-containing protein [Myxococcota bacterium]|nr:DUF4340 domain-containing protein [Myxococcota bacterium]HRY95454.1 DUF4340 domain-containing protein [Myxococcota bacterium]HSA22123.1 DUF4340 domain-containing protein [Myxococcota bacterium]
MKLGGVLGLHAALLLASAAAAYAVYSYDPNSPDEGPLVLDASPAQTERLVYTNKGRVITASLLADGGFQLEVDEDKILPPVKATPGAPGEPAAPPESAPAKPERVKSRYRASDEFGKALERMLPLHAVQALGKLSDEQREKFGLKESLSTLELRAKGQAVSLRVGNQTYGGTSAYLERVGDGEAFLVSSATLRAVDFRPPRYMERRLGAQGMAEVDWLQVDCAGQGRRVLVRAHAGAGQPERWTPEEDPSAADELFRNWVEKVFRLSAQEYLAEPPAAPLQGCRLALRAEGKPVGEIELAWREEAPGKAVHFARSTFTGGWVKLEATGAGQVSADLPAVFGGARPGSP